MNKKKIIGWFLLGIGLLGVVLASRHYYRYSTQSSMNVKLEELSAAQYPENTSYISVLYQKYAKRKLEIKKHNQYFFDFTLLPGDKESATIRIKNIDLRLFVPETPAWIRDKSNATIIALVDREWNRQQVNFSLPSKNITITGGNGVEKQHITGVSLAKNCLNSGLWEIILTTKENGLKKSLYQAWFTFPLGFYKEVFKQLNAPISWWSHWFRLEHWLDPEGTKLDLTDLRGVKTEYTSPSMQFHGAEKVFAAGEQIRKIRTFQGVNIRTYADFYKDELNQDIHFATFIPPGFYDHDVPWKHKYWRIAKFKHAIRRKIVHVTDKNKLLDELELVYADSRTGELNRLFIGGIDLNTLPSLPMASYNKGLYMPMGISVPPFYQEYKDLVKDGRPAQNSSYYSFILNANDEWIDHHSLAVDGPVMHRDINNPNLIHLYLLSYERHTLIAHYTFLLTETI